MDFFEYKEIVDTIIFLYTGRLGSIYAYIVGGICFAVVYGFQAVGLWTIAGRAGYKNRWMAFVPFLNVYYIGVCAQKNRFFRVDTRIMSLIAAIAEVILFSLYVVNDVSYNLLSGTGCFYELNNALEINYDALPLNLDWAAWCWEYLEIFITVFDLAYLFALVVTLSCFFQTYSARRYFLFTFTSILFPIRGILIFVVRNNAGMNYMEYQRRMQEQAYRMYRNQQDYYRNPYEGNGYNNNGYNNNGYNNGYPGDSRRDDPPPKQDDPFEGYGDGKDKSSDDPFDEFKN